MYAIPMANKRLAQIERRIEKIKAELAEVLCEDLDNDDDDVKKKD